MVKFTAQIDRYEENNVFFVGKEKPLFIPPTEILTAMKNFPAGKVVTAATKAKEKGSLEGMAEPTAAEMRSYQQDKAAGEAQSPPEFKSGKQLLQDNLDAMKAKTAAAAPSKSETAPEKPADVPKEKPATTEPTGPKPAAPAKPACFKPALCSKTCDGSKDPCPFKPKPKAAEPEKPASPPPAKPPQNVTHQPSAGGSPAKQTNPQEALKQGQARELIESIVNADPRVLDYIAEHDPELWRTFMDRMTEVFGDIKKVEPEFTFPSAEDLLKMVINYDTYWKAKTIMDLKTSERIEKQMEFANWLKCINTAITYAQVGNPAGRPTSKEVYEVAEDIYRNIVHRINSPDE